MMVSLVVIKVAEACLKASTGSIILTIDWTCGTIVGVWCEAV